MKQKYLSVIIPAYNEEKRITKTLKAIISYLEKQEYTWEIVVVNDGSKDSTSQKVLEFGYPDVRLESYETNQGKGHAVKTGMLAAEGEYSLLVDADNATPFTEFEKLAPFIEKYEVIIGSRYLKNSNVVIKQPLLRRLGARAGNLLIQLLILPGIQDTQCGFKLFKSDAAKKIFKYLTINRWGFDMEILVIAKKLGYKIKEVPVEWHDVAGSKVESFGVFFNTLVELFTIKRRYFWGIPDQK